MKPLAAVVLVLVFVAPAGFGDDSGVLDRRLVDAAADGDLGAVEALIAAGADPNARIDGYPALQFAVGDGTVEVVEALLAAGADVNAFGEWVPGCCQDRDTALHQAVRYWHMCDDHIIEFCSKRAKVIQVLLAAGADWAGALTRRSRQRRTGLIVNVLRGGSVQRDPEASRNIIVLTPMATSTSRATPLGQGSRDRPRALAVTSSAEPLESTRQ